MGNKVGPGPSLTCSSGSPVYPISIQAVAAVLNEEQDMESWMTPAFARAWMASAPVSAVARARTGSALIMALVMALWGLHSTPVLAHAMLVKAEPPRRAQLTQPPAQVRLWFNEEV